MKLGMMAITATLAISAQAGAAMLADPVDWVTDIRRCSASFSGNGSGSTWQDRTVAFDPYQGAADIFVTNTVETWSGHCTQESEMDGSSASFQASSSATILAGLLSNPQQCQAQAKFDLWFTVASDIEYRIEGQVSESGHSDAMAMVRLTNLQGDVIELVTSTTDSSRAFHLSGVLEPGTYRLYGEALGKCRTVPMVVVAEGAATCSMSFTAEPAPVTPPPSPVRPTVTSSTGQPPPRR